MATQVLTDFTVENKEFYDTALLKRLLPNLVFTKYGQKKPLPKNHGDTISFRKFSPLEPATTPLTEGVTPSGSDMKISEIKATIKQYGDFIEVSDIFDKVGNDPVITENCAVLGEQAGLNIDNVVRDILVAGTNVQYAGGVASTATVAAKISSDEVMKIARTLRAANAKPLQDGCFIAVVDPFVAFDLMNDKLWQDVSKYNGGTEILKGEIGKLSGVRFIQTTETKVKTGAGSGSKDVHCVLVFGKDAYGVIDLEGSGAKPEIIVKDFGSSGTADPLNQRATQGWKAEFTAIRLNELAMLRFECIVSD